MLSKNFPNFVRAATFQNACKRLIADFSKFYRASCLERFSRIAALRKIMEVIGNNLGKSILEVFNYKVHFYKCTSFVKFYRINFSEDFYVIAFVFTYSSTDNFLSSMPVSHWSTFCRINSILHPKKKWKW